MQIKPVNSASGSRTGRLVGVSFDEIVAKLGFEPNIEDDPDKVTHSWAFAADGNVCGIWDYYGARWSTYGDPMVFQHLFGDRYISEQSKIVFRN